MSPTTLPCMTESVMYTLWHRTRRGQRWEPVASADIERELIRQIGTGERKNGDWLILPSGREP